MLWNPTNIRISKEGGDVWNQMAVNLSGLDQNANKGSMRDRLTLLITKHKAKIRQEENSTGITCEETELEQALEDIIDTGSWPTKKAPR